MKILPVMARPIGLSQAELCALLEYEPSTGVLTWRARRKDLFSSDKSWRTWNTRFAGVAAGTIKQSAGKEYVQVRVLGRCYPAHRLIWTMLHGGIPDSMVIDHVNGDGTDNRLSNIRSVTHQENQQNMVLRKDNETGVPGVRWVPARKKWYAKITVNKLVIHLGCFETPEEAASARYIAQRQAGFHPLHGLPLCERRRLHEATS